MGSLDISKSFRWHPLPKKWAISKLESIMILWFFSFFCNYNHRFYIFHWKTGNKWSKCFQNQNSLKSGWPLLCSISNAFLKVLSIVVFFCLHPSDGSKMPNIPALRTSWVCAFSHPAYGWSIYSPEAMEQMIHVPHASHGKTKCILSTHRFKNLSTACCTSANSLTYAELVKDCDYINAS